MFTQLPPGVRTARPTDYDVIAPVLDLWWGRPILDALPRLFLDHFHATSLVVDSLMVEVAEPGAVTSEHDMPRERRVIDRAPVGIRHTTGDHTAGDHTAVGDAVSGPPRAFLIGLLSPSHPDEAYIHFVGVAPAHRGEGLARLLYTTFFAAAARSGRRRVSCVTSPVNTGSIAFHRALGFSVAAARADYNGPDRALVAFHRTLDLTPVTPDDHADGVALT